VLCCIFTQFRMHLDAAAYFVYFPELYSSSTKDGTETYDETVDAQHGQEMQPCDRTAPPEARMPRTTIRSTVLEAMPAAAGAHLNPQQQSA
jgi:hypothetical protein